MREKELLNFNDCKRDSKKIAELLRIMSHRTFINDDVTCAFNELCDAARCYELMLQQVEREQL